MKRFGCAELVRVAINTAWKMVPGIDNDYPIGSPRSAVSSGSGHAHASRWRFNRWQWEPVYLFLFMWAALIGVLVDRLFVWGGLFVVVLIVAAVLMISTRRVSRSTRRERSP